MARRGLSQRARTRPITGPVLPAAEALALARDPSAAMAIGLDALLRALAMDKGCVLGRGPRAEVVFARGRARGGADAGPEDFLLRRGILDQAEARAGPRLYQRRRKGECVMAAVLERPPADAQPARADALELLDEPSVGRDLVYLVGSDPGPRFRARAIAPILRALAIALAQTRLMARLERERRRLTGLYRLALAAGSAPDLQGLIGAALDIVIGETGSGRGLIVLFPGDEDDEGDDAGFAAGRDSTGQPLQARDAGISYHPPRATPLKLGDGIDLGHGWSAGPDFPQRFPTCMPLQLELAGGVARTLGLLCLDRVLAGGVEQREALDVLAGQIASTVERHRLRQTQAQRLRIQDEIRQAEKVQALLLPRRVPDLVGLSIDVEYHLSRGLGGDYYDFIDMDGDRVGIAIADVLGHSVSSAIVMSTCRTLLREYCRRDASPSRVLRQANDTLERDLPDDMFVTLFLGVLDLRTGALTYANAGQCYPLHFRHAERDIQVLAVGGLPLGFQRGVDYREASVELQPADLLVLYTDGATEVRVGDGRQLGVKGLTAIVRRVMLTESPRLAREIYKAIVEEAEGAGMGDDVTLIACRVARGIEREAWEIASTEEAVRAAVERAERFARRRGFVSERTLQFRLVLTEALTNALEHGNRRDPSKAIALLLCADGKRMSVRIRDQGEGYDVERVLEQAADPDLTSARGRGLTIVKRYVDALAVADKGNAVTMTFSKSTF